MKRITTPLLTVDIIIRMTDQPGQPVVLIERRNPPHGWALPGGFVDVGETTEKAAIREALEETCLSVQLECLLGVYSDPRRDPRQHTVSVIYIASASGTPRAEDDAKNIKLFELNSIPTKLAFDHSIIVKDYKNYIHSKALTPLRYQ